MAEAILSEVLPEIAREAYLAFKAVVKVHVNQIVDELGEFHKVESYFLKTILLRLVESTNPMFWDLEADLETAIPETESQSSGGAVSETTSEASNNDDEHEPYLIDLNSRSNEVMQRNTIIDLDEFDENDALLEEREGEREEERSDDSSTSSYEEFKDLEGRRKKRTVAFFHKLFENLHQCYKDKSLPHYWNPEINLFAKYTDPDFVFILNQIRRIRRNYKACLIDDWVELQRIIASCCCSCCLPSRKPAKFIPVREPVHLNCCRFKLKGIDFESDLPRWDINPAKVYVY